MDRNGVKNRHSTGRAQEAVFIAACSLLLLLYSLYHHHFDRNVTEWKTSPFLFPVLTAVFGILLSAALFSEARRERKRGAEQTGGGEADTAGRISSSEEIRAGEIAVAGSGTASLTRRQTVKSVLLFICISVCYDILLPVLHFLPATVLYLAVLFFLLGERKVWKICASSAAGAAAVYLLFGVLLNVRLP